MGVLVAVAVGVQVGGTLVEVTVAVRVGVGCRLITNTSGQTTSVVLIRITMFPRSSPV